MYKIQGNEVLIGSNEKGWKHYGFVNIKRQVIESNIIKIKAYEFDLTAEDYILDDDNDTTFTYYKDNVETPATFTDGVYIVDTTGLTKVTIKVEGEEKTYKQVDSNWQLDSFTEYQPVISATDNYNCIQTLLRMNIDLMNRVKTLEEA